MDLYLIYIPVIIRTDYDEKNVHHIPFSVVAVLPEPSYLLPWSASGSYFTSSAKDIPFGVVSVAVIDVRRRLGRRVVGYRCPEGR